MLMVSLYFAGCAFSHIFGSERGRNAEKKGLFFQETFCHGTRFVKVSTLRQHFAAVGQTQSCLLDTIATAIANVRYTLKYVLKIRILGKRATCMRQASAVGLFKAYLSAAYYWDKTEIAIRLYCCDKREGKQKRHSKKIAQISDLAELSNEVTKEKILPNTYTHRILMLFSIVLVSQLTLTLSFVKEFFAVYLASKYSLSLDSSIKTLVP